MEFGSPWCVNPSPPNMHSRAAYEHAKTAFDVIAFCLAISNGFDQPYREHVEVLFRLKRDGSLFFLVSPCTTVPRA